MHYFSILEPNNAGGFIVRFPQIPEALTEGANTGEALDNAADALEVALLGRMKDGELPPVLDKCDGKGVPVYVHAQAAAKLALFAAFRASGLSQSALGRRLGKSEVEIRRMLDPYHATKLPALDEAIRALGQRLYVALEPAAQL